MNERKSVKSEVGEADGGHVVKSKKKKKKLFFEGVGGVGIPWQSSWLGPQLVRILWRAWIQSLVGKLKFCKPNGTAKKQIKALFLKKNFNFKG